MKLKKPRTAWVTSSNVCDNGLTGTKGAWVLEPWLGGRVCMGTLLANTIAMLLASLWKWYKTFPIIE